MRRNVELEATIVEKYAVVEPYLDERGRRIWAATESRAIGYRGDALVSDATGLSRPTIHKGHRELESGGAERRRIRRAGAGRPGIKQSQPGIKQALEKLVDPVTRGDPSEAARDTGVVMRQLFKTARNRVLAVGFAVHQGREIFEELANRLDEEEGLEATLCIDVRRERSNTSAAAQIVEAFARNFAEKEWPGKRLPRLYYDPRSLGAANTVQSALHAKCVVIDGTEALVTSANFTAAAQDRNIELGLPVNSLALGGRRKLSFQVTEVSASKRAPR